MLLRDELLQSILRRLTVLKEFVTSSNSLNLNNINVSAENFFRDFYSLFGYSFSNTNLDSANFAYIDLIDRGNKEAIQVTSQNDAEKIRSTVVGFLGKPENEGIRLRVLLIAREAKDYRVDFTDAGKYTFDTQKDIYDMNRLYAEISDLPLEKMQAVASFLEKEIPLGAIRSELSEVGTIMTLLEWLSLDENYSELNEAYECDPEKKINNRFKEHARVFKDDYLLLLPIYGGALSDSKQHFGFDSVRALKVSVFLLIKSNEFLDSCAGNPRQALMALESYLVDKISRNGVQVDANAIRFFLLEELIGCNVFSERVV